MTDPRHALLAEAGAIRSMGEAVRWASARKPAAVFVTAVAQDEFTFDVLVRVDEQAYLVFDTT